MAIKKESNSESDPSSYFEIDEECECGRRYDIGSRVIGGEETQPNEYPWAVAIFRKGKIFCGGSLINDKYVLTAGHCLHW
ncbi:conserved hypothetical protein [Pediculus humanus corporis]|uniref:Peptidase S1 domain-containing protein n=1 Tax=Pediculus humanus subsp. corporis TaxID=121224 RepID=E0VW15_PEDHC|nr:uncharacterized protein Phum_PHUM472650 [Pediculus humanus corporis]EEB17571.1 conserved hypothetical protein [Pediculus humanus corporis]